MVERYDAVVLGSGFAGSLLSMILVGQGYSVLLVEKGHHPRFVIGESTTPITNWLLERLGRDHGVPELGDFSKWGVWQKKHADIPVGLKRGFTFFHHEWDRPFVRGAEREHELLVAASPGDAIADTHWYRPAIDPELVRWAVKRGVVLYEDTICEGVQEVEGEGKEGRIRLRLRNDRRGVWDVEAQHCFDASGGRGGLSRLLGLKEGTLEGYPTTRTLYAHWEGVRRLETVESFDRGGGVEPYPADDAAVHHVFPGGWIWVLRFNHGVVSAGVALKDSVADEVGLEAGEAGWQRLMKRLPGVAASFEGARVVTPWVYQKQMPFVMERAVGRRWTLLPGAYGFVDPMLSTGFPLTLLGLGRLARIVKKHGLGVSQEGEAAFSDYEAVTSRELRRVSRLIAAMYGSMGDFPRFVLLAKLYFGAVIYTETCLRLGDEGRCGDEFLLGGEARFGPGLDRVLDGWGGAGNRQEAEAAVNALLGPLDLADLVPDHKRRWYGVDFDAFRRTCWKVGASGAQAEELIQRALGGLA